MEILKRFTNKVDVAEKIIRGERDKKNMLMIVIILSKKK